MVPHTYRWRILRALCVKPGTVRTFTEGNVTLAVPVRFVEACFADLVADGLIEALEGDRFIATSAGVALITAPTTVASARTHVSAALPTWVPPKWNPSRAGADDHRRFASRGIGA